MKRVDTMHAAQAGAKYGKDLWRHDDVMIELHERMAFAQLKHDFNAITRKIKKFVAEHNSSDAFRKRQLRRSEAFQNYRRHWHRKCRAVQKSILKTIWKIGDSVKKHRTEKAAKKSSKRKTQRLPGKCQNC